MSTYLSARDVADRFKCSPVTVQRLARRFGLGLKFDGSIGYRFTEADVTAMTNALTPKPQPKRRRSA